MRHSRLSPSLSIPASFKEGSGAATRGLERSETTRVTRVTVRTLLSFLSRADSPGATRALLSSDSGLLTNWRNGPQPDSCSAASFEAVYDFRLQWRAPLLPGRRFHCGISAVQTINSILGIVVSYWGTPCGIDLMCC
jgi:hypothetical protein